MKTAARYVPASQAVIDGEVVDRRETAAPAQQPVPHLQARVVPRLVPPPPAQPPQQAQIRVRLGDSVALALPSGVQGIAIAAGAVLAWKFVLPKVAEYLNSRTPQRKRRRIKTGGV